MHDASLDQLEHDLMETQQKLQEQSQRTVAFVKAQQNNFVDIRASIKAAKQKHVIFEVTEAAEDDVAQLIPQKRGSVQSQTQKIDLAKVNDHQLDLVKKNVPGTVEARNEVQTSTPEQSPSDQPSTFKNRSQLNTNLSTKATNQQKMSKMISKNKMKLKLAAEILNLKKNNDA